jgi:hypothetical protein
LRAAQMPIAARMRIGRISHIPSATLFALRQHLLWSDEGAQNGWYW